VVSWGLDCPLVSFFFSWLVPLSLPPPHISEKKCLNIASESSNPHSTNLNKNRPPPFHCFCCPPPNPQTMSYTPSYLHSLLLSSQCSSPNEMKYPFTSLASLLPSHSQTLAGSSRPALQLFHQSLVMERGQICRLGLLLVGNEDGWVISIFLRWVVRVKRAKNEIWLCTPLLWVTCCGCGWFSFFFLNNTQTK
jgi:hypothetical protein